MELIPILSAIILIATISTFILAVGAYILYKVREKRGNIEKQQGYHQVEAELISPRTRYSEPEEDYSGREYAYSPFRRESTAGINDARARNRNVPETAPEFNTLRESPDKKESSKFFKYTPDGYVPLNKSSKAEKTEENLKWR